MESSNLKNFLFASFICISLNVEGGHIVTMCSMFAKMYGPDGGFRVFAVGFTFFLIPSMIHIVIIDHFLDKSGWLNLGFNGICNFYNMLGLISLVLLYFFNEKKVVLK